MDFSKLSVAQQLIYTTLHIIRTVDWNLTSTWTWFLVDDKDRLYIVTNSHVISGDGDIFVTFSIPKDTTLRNPDTTTIQLPSKDWFTSDEYDVSILDVTSIKDSWGGVFWRSISLSLIPGEQQLANIDTIENVIFIGYPNSLVDTHNNTPIVRQWITATPIAYDYQGKKEFLVDASVFPGSSGSPVFIYSKGPSSDPNWAIVITWWVRIFFVWILRAVHLKNSYWSLVPVEIPTWIEIHTLYQDYIDLGIVIKSEVIRSIIRSK